MWMASARELSDRYTEAINAHDADGIAALFADDGVFEDPTGRYEGRDEIRLFWQQMLTAFPDMSAEDTFKAESASTAINEWLLAGTNTGPMETPERTVSATGRRVAMKGTDAITERNGLIVSQRVYYDQLALMSQLGLVTEGALAS
jgi:steroid delta-isomerase-like uncharacterized protein